MAAMIVSADYYQQFDADFSLEVPAEGYGGWRTADIELSPEHTAVVVMHAWDAGTRETYPGWYRSVEYLPRASEIAGRFFPPLLAAVRASSLALFHVIGGGPESYYAQLPGYRRALKLAGPEPPAPEKIPADPVHERLTVFKTEHAFIPPHNREDVGRGFRNLDFHPAARPAGDEGVARSAHQLFALCRERGVNHLVYAGFAINWCLLLSSGGMHDMARRGFICSALRQAVTAVENRETARRQLGKELALWRVGLQFGFVFDVEKFIAALGKA